MAAFPGYFGRDQCTQPGLRAVRVRRRVGQDLLWTRRNDPVSTARHELCGPTSTATSGRWWRSTAMGRFAPASRESWPTSPRTSWLSCWREKAVKVIAIEPEFENWLWQDNRAWLSVALSGRAGVARTVGATGWWPAGKRNRRARRNRRMVLRQTRRRAPPRSMKNSPAAFRSRLRRRAFLELHATLQAWFPRSRRHEVRDFKNARVVRRVGWRKVAALDCNPYMSGRWRRGRRSRAWMHEGAVKVAYYRVCWRYLQRRCFGVTMWNRRVWRAVYHERNDAVG